MRILGCVLAICVPLTMFFSDPAATLWAAERPAGRWYTNFQEAKKAAKQKQLPLLVHFHASWCGACVEMEQSVLNTPRILRQLGTRVIGVKVDSDEAPDLTSRFGISTLPSDLFLAPSGRVLSQAVGGDDVAGYRTQLNRVSGRFLAAKKRQALLAKTELQSSPGQITNADQLLPANMVALKGFSPVAIVVNRQWKKGSAEFSWKHDDIVYQMASAEELEQFKADVNRFVPGWSGLDPLMLVEEQKTVIGDIRFGAFFRQRLYLLSSNKNRSEFVANPTIYEDLDFESLSDASFLAAD